MHFSRAAYDACRHFKPENLETQAAEIAEKITLWPMPSGELNADQIFKEMKAKGYEHLILLDQRVIDAEQRGKRTTYGYELESENLKLTVIDHHVRDSEFSELSTTNLAIRYIISVSEGAPGNAKIAITHSDCDSVLSALMMLGLLQPAQDTFGEAAIAADHSFEKNDIADLLQSIEITPKAGQTVTAHIPKHITNLEKESLYTNPETDSLKPSLELSIRNLGLLLQGKSLDYLAQQSLNKRLDARQAWQDKLNQRQIIKFPNKTYLCEITEIPAQDPYPEFLRKLIPDARIIIVSHPSPTEPDFQQIRVLRGMAAGSEIRLDDRNLISHDLIPGFGGRADAGSNRRSGISFSGNIKEVAAQIDLKIRA